VIILQAIFADCVGHATLLIRRSRRRRASRTTVRHVAPSCALHCHTHTHAHTMCHRPTAVICGCCCTLWDSACRVCDWPASLVDHLARCHSSLFITCSCSLIEVLSPQLHHQRVAVACRIVLLLLTCQPPVAPSASIGPGFPPPGVPWGVRVNRRVGQHPPSRLLRRYALAMVRQHRPPPHPLPALRLLVDHRQPVLCHSVCIKRVRCPSWRRPRTRRTSL